jgi:accessory colonization factor AcfC
MKTHTINRYAIYFFSLFTILAAATAWAAVSEQSEYQPRDGVIRLYGAGGPHTALIRAGKEYTLKTGIPVEVVFGPEKTWSEKALQNADIIWGTSEQSMTAFLQTYKEFRSAEVEPLYIRRAVITVQKGNPKQIRGFDDLLKPGVGIVVTDGSGVSNTSGTGVWEDIAGRLGSLENVKAFRRNIIAFATGSGASFKAFKEQNADAWITWIHWPLTHPEDADVVELPPELVIYRDFSVVTNEKADDATRDFIAFLKGDAGFAIFKSEGWSK